jgi:hypothetical protein
MCMEKTEAEDKTRDDQKGADRSRTKFIKE